MPAASGTGPTVLVVEDEYFVALSIQRVLEESGLIVAGPVPTVEAALAALERALPDIALLDANLRGTSVAPVAGRLAARGVPFALVTGYLEPLATDDALLGSAPRLRKPFTPPQIATLVAQMLDAGERDREGN